MSQIGEKERLQVLLAEYATLRSEIVQRMTWQIQMWTVGGTLSVVIFGYMLAHGVVWIGTILLIIAAMILAVGSAFNGREIRGLAAQVKLLEESINLLVGSDLLSWERLHGVLAIGTLSRWRQFFDRRPN